MTESVPIRPRGGFYGITTSLDVGGVMLSEVYHETEREVPLHGHEAPYFCMLLEGGYRETSGDRHMQYGPFTIVFHAAGMLHVDAIGVAGARFFMIELGDRWAEVARDFMPERVPLAELRGGEVVWTALRLYLDVQAGTVTELTVESALYELIGGLHAMKPVDAREEAEAAAEVAAIIDDGYGETLSLAVLAQRVARDPAHLARVFRRRYGRSVGEYIQGRRIQAASRAMLNSRQPIAEIAVTCGFFDQSHFNRLFKSVTGTTPKEYRKRLGARTQSGSSAT